MFRIFTAAVISNGSKIKMLKLKKERYFKDIKMFRIFFSGGASFSFDKYLLHSLSGADLECTATKKYYFVGLF